MTAQAPLVLNVEDEAAQRYATSRVLRQAGFRVEEAESGGEALRLAALKPDAIVLDVKLPDMNGREVVRRLRADPETASIPILHLTASDRSPETWATALDSGADGFLVAPVEPAVLVATLRALLRARRAENAMREQWEVLDTVTRVGQMLAAELDPRRVVQAVSDAVRDLTRARFAAVLGAAAKDAPPPVLASTGLAAQAAAALGEELRGPSADTVTTADRLVVPVISRAGQVSGLLVAGGPPPGGFGAKDELILRGLAGQTAVALDNARLFEETQQLYREAVEANRLKDEFLATLSHELRTPLNAIVGWAHLLRAGRLDAPTTAKAIDTIARNAEAQNQLISDILDVSRIVAGKLRLEIAPVDFAAVIDAAVDTVRPGADAKEIRLERIVDPAAGPITGDAQRLQQVVWNLLSNAVKFTPRKGRVQLRLETTDSQVRLTVADTGPGIAAEFLPHVFERFRQDASTARRHAGLGLGLAIVRHLVELHGGTVRAANREDGTGAVFTVLLPRRAVADVAAGPAVLPAVGAEAGTSALAGVTVLVVDDDADARELVGTVLEAAGAKVTLAGSAREALDAFEREPPHLVLSDLEMPEEDGYALIRAIRSRPAERGGLAPAVALTAYATTQDRLKALRAGFQTHLAKPVQPAEIVATAESLLRLGLLPARAGVLTD